MKKRHLTALGGALILASACTTIPQQAQSASGVSVELLDACSRLTADYIYNQVEAAEETPNPVKAAETEDEIVETDAADQDPVIATCLSILDREMLAQSYALQDRNYTSGYSSYTYWQPYFPHYGYYGAFGRYYGDRRFNRFGTYGDHFNRHRGGSASIGTPTYPGALRGALNRAGRNNLNTPPPASSPPSSAPPQQSRPAALTPTRAAPPARPQPARTYTPPRNRTTPSVPKQRD